MAFTFSELVEPLAGLTTTDGNFSSFVAIGAIPALTGSLRLANAGDIVVRNQNDNGDFNVISFDASANMDIGDAGMPRIRFTAGPIVDLRNRMVTAVDSTAAFAVQDAAFANIFLVDTVGESVALSSAAELRWSTDLKLFRDGPWELALRDGTNDNFFYVYGTFTDSSNYERLAVYAGSVDFFIEAQTAGTGADDINMHVGAAGAGNVILENSAGSLTLRASTSSFDFIADNAIAIGRSNTARPSLIHTATSVNIGLTKTVPDDAIILEMANLGIDGFTDSQSVRWTGKSRDSSVNIDADWRSFVDMQNNDGTASLWTLATRIDAAGYVNVLNINDTAGLSLPLNSAFYSIGVTPATTGAIRLFSNAAMTWRNVANDNNVFVLSVQTADVIHFGEFNSGGITVHPTMNASNAIGYALLNEASSGTNPTLVPNRADLTTGIGGFDQGPGGHFLNLIVQGNNIASFDTTVGTFNIAALKNNGSFFVDALGDAVQLLVRGFSTQTNDLFRIQQDPGVNVVRVNNDGDLQVDGSVGVGNLAEGGTGKVERTSSRERHTLSLAATSVTTTLAVPAGARLLGASFNVDGTVIDDAGDDTWDAAFSGGSTTPLIVGASPTAETKVDTLIVDEISSGVVEITFTPNGGNFSAGIIDVVVYYEVLTSLADN